MKTLLGFSLLAASLLYADASVDPAKSLYEAGLRQTREGKFESARQILQSLVNAYPRDPLALQAKGAIDATLLFEEGEQRAKAGKIETAKLAFETLIVVYPENPLVTRAQAALNAIAAKQKKATVVKAVEFRDVPAVPADELRAAMEAREVRLSVGRPYRARDLEEARTAIESILAEKGVANAHVQARIRSVPHDAVAVIFTAEKSHTSLLTAPFRMAAAGWRKVRPGNDNPGI